MIFTPRKIYDCVKRAGYNAIIVHDGIEHAGYLAFLGLLALFPFLVFVFAVIGVIGQGESGAALISSLLQTLPSDITAALKPRILEIVSGPPQGLITLSILGAIWTASSAVEGIRTVLNRAYHVPTPPAYLFRRSLSILQLLLFTSILIFAMLVVITLPLLLRNIEAWLGIHLLTEHQDQINQLLFVFTFFLLFMSIAGIYYMIPNIKQNAVSVIPGAAIVVILWMGAAYLFTLYLSNFHQVNLIYGSLGGIIAALVFFYICNIIFIFGAEFNYQLVEALGIRVIEKETGIDVTDSPEQLPPS